MFLYSLFWRLILEGLLLGFWSQSLNIHQFYSELTWVCTHTGWYETFCVDVYVSLESTYKHRQEGKDFYISGANLHTESICSSLLGVLKISNEIQKSILTKTEHLVMLKGRLEGNQHQSILHGSPRLGCCGSEAGVLKLDIFAVPLNHGMTGLCKSQSVLYKLNWTKLK